MYLRYSRTHSTTALFSITLMVFVCVVCYTIQCSSIGSYMLNLRKTSDSKPVSTPTSHSTKATVKATMTVSSTNTAVVILPLPLKLVTGSTALLPVLASSTTNLTWDSSTRYFTWNYEESVMMLMVHEPDGNHYLVSYTKPKLNSTP